ncbi:MAG: folate-binding protein YgfZ [Bradymonadia bacterium]|jgi:folate-binding protein YgfZ
MTGGGYGVSTDINGKVLFDGTFGMNGGGVLAVLPATHTEFALAHIDRYVIMEDVEATLSEDVVVEFPLEAASELGLRIDSEEPGHVLKFEFGGHTGRGFQATGSTTAGDRVLVLVSADAVEALANHVNAVERDLEDRIREEVVLGVPRIDRDFFVNKTVPVEAGLWNGVSLSKGCYLGQEILERLFSLGSASRRLVMFGIEGAVVAPGTVIRAGEKVAGEVTSCTESAAGTVGLVYIKRKFADANLTLEDGRSISHNGFVGGDWPQEP